MSYKISREKYAAMYGPTTGDRVRLADTDLVAEIEKDCTSYGDEAKFGGGKTLRDGMGQASEITSAGGALDLVLTNAIVMDPVQGIVKADIGIKAGRIVGIGKAGNPDIMEGVTPGMTVGASTEALAAEGLIVTPGGIDSHIHFISPQQIETALYSGITTMVGGGTGPADGTNATTCTPGPWNLREMLRAADAYPMNLGFLGRQLLEPASACRADRGGRDGAQDPRGLGRDTGRHRCLPARLGCLRCPDGHPHGHAE